MIGNFNCQQVKNAPKQTVNGVEKVARRSIYGEQSNRCFIVFDRLICVSAVRAMKVASF